MWKFIFLGLDEIVSRKFKLLYDSFYGKHKVWFMLSTSDSKILKTLCTVISILELWNILEIKFLFLQILI